MCNPNRQVVKMSRISDIIAYANEKMSRQCPEYLVFASLGSWVKLQCELEEGHTINHFVRRYFSRVYWKVKPQQAGVKE